MGKVLQDHPVLCENVYNMDETGVMLSVLGSVTVHLTMTVDSGSRNMVQKQNKAAHMSFTQTTLQQAQFQFLHSAINEAKVRRSTKSVRLGTAKVMIYGKHERSVLRETPRKPTVR